MSTVEAPQADAAEPARQKESLETVVVGLS